MVLFAVFPVVMATVDRPELFGKLLIGMTLAGIGLLAVTPGFRWRGLLRGGPGTGFGGGWRVVAAFSACTAVVCTALVL